MLAGEMKQFRWMDNIDWVENDGKGNAILDENKLPKLKADAPFEAWESYRHWLKKEEKRKKRDEWAQAVLERIERGEIDE